MQFGEAQRLQFDPLLSSATTPQWSTLEREQHTGSSDLLSELRRNLQVHHSLNAIQNAKVACSEIVQEAMLKHQFAPSQQQAATLFSVSLFEASLLLVLCEG